MESEALTDEELAKFWKGAVKVATLRTWRCRGEGPKWFKIGRQPMYAMEDILQYEREQVDKNNSLDS